MGATYVTCEPNAWTALWNAPTLGFVYLWNGDPTPATVNWRRFGADVPFYLEGTVWNLSGKVAVGHGLPSFFVRFEVMPQTRTNLMVT